MLSDPTTCVAVLSSLGALTSTCSARAGNYFSYSSWARKMLKQEQITERRFESRLNYWVEIIDLLLQAQWFLEEVLAAPESMNDPVIRARVGEAEMKGPKAESL